MSKAIKNDLIDTVFSPVKIFSHMERMNDWHQGKNIYPITMELGPSGPANCNNKCDFCMHRKYYQAEAMMSFDFYKKILDELKGLGTKGMIYSASGEPLTNPEIIDFIKYTKESGIDLALVTNGTSLKKEGIIPAILENVTWMRVSLNAGTPETRKKIHGVDDFELVLKSLKALAEEKAKTGSQCNIGAQIVVTENNISEIYDATKLVKESGIDYFKIKPVVFHPEDGAKQLSPDFWTRALNLSESARDDFDGGNFKVYIKYDQFGAIMKPDHDKGAYSTCRATFFPIIEADGKVYNCSQTRGMPEFELGDLNKNTFKEIWESDQRKKVIANIDVSKCQPVCRCHWMNKMLKSIDKKENAPSFV